jgi:hypothetical protein
MSDTTTTQPEGYDADLEANEFVQRAREATESIGQSIEARNIADLDLDMVIAEAIAASDTAAKNYIETQVLGISKGGSVSTQKGNVGRLALLPVGGGRDPLRILTQEGDDDPFVITPASDGKPVKLARGEKFWKRTIRTWQSKRVKYDDLQGIKTKPQEAFEEVLSQGGNLQSTCIRILNDIENWEFTTTLENLIAGTAAINKAKERVIANGDDDGTLSNAMAKAELLAEAIIQFNDVASKV